MICWNCWGPRYPWWFYWDPGFEQLILQCHISRIACQTQMWWAFGVRSVWPLSVAAIRTCTGSANLWNNLYVSQFALLEARYDLCTTTVLRGGVIEPQKCKGVAWFLANLFALLIATILKRSKSMCWLFSRSNIENPNFDNFRQKRQMPILQTIYTFCVFGGFHPGGFVRLVFHLRWRAVMRRFTLKCGGWAYPHAGYTSLLIFAVCGWRCRLVVH